MAKLSFGAQIDSWVKETEARIEAVFRESARRTVSLAISYTPIQTGFLRASVRVSLQSMPQVDPKATGPGTAAPGGDYVMAIAGAELGQTIYAGWTAAYGPFVEFGTSKMAPRAFVARAAAQWPATVRQVSQELRARAGGRV